MPIPVIQKIRKLIILFKYSQEYARLLKRQNNAFQIKGKQKVNLDKGVRWNSTSKHLIIIIFIYFLKYFRKLLLKALLKN